VLEGVVLQAALAGLVADRAVERMVDEEELHHPALRLGDLRALGRDDHAVLRHLRRAPGLELRHAVDLDQTHAALADHRQSRVVAVVRHLDADLGGSLDQVGPGLDLDAATVDGDRRHQWASTGAASAKTRWRG
jgi:hypothetical protein